jgi:hypothetical protein
MGLRFGVYIFVFVSIFLIVMNPSQYFLILLIGLPTCTLGGLGFGFTMKYWMGRRGEKSSENI